jgi:hypothetical protein
MKKFIHKQSLKLSSLVVLGMMSGVDDAYAINAGNEGKFNEIGKDIIGGIDQLPGLITGTSYMLGTLLGVLGVLKIKDHVEAPTQTPLQHGVIRLAAGGGLFALPIITESMTTLLDANGEATGAGTARVAKVEYGFAGGE